MPAVLNGTSTARSDELTSTHGGTVPFRTSPARDSRYAGAVDMVNPEAAETRRQERERLRETAETARIAAEAARSAAEAARTASEEARAISDAARNAVVDAVRETADALTASLGQMQVVEDMRRTLREIRDANKLDDN